MTTNELTVEAVEAIEQIDVTNEDLLEVLAKYAAGMADGTHVAIDNIGERVLAEPVGVDEMIDGDYAASFSVGALVDEDGVVDRVEKELLVGEEVATLDAKLQVA